MRLLILLLFAFPAFSQITAVRLARLWDGSRIVDRPLVVIENGRVKSVQPGDPAPPPGAALIDWSRYYGLPGLIDVHTHMTFVNEGPAGTVVRRLNPLPAITVFLAQENAKKTLAAGVTTVRDLGATEYSDIAMRDLINRGAMPGPRMFVSGYGISMRRTGNLGPGSAGTPDQVREAIRRQVTAGADVIKMYGSVGGFDNVNTTQTFTYEEMKAAVEQSHAAGKRIAIHSYGPEGARDAVRAGCDSLEHAVDIDDETLALMAKQKIYYVPTIDHNRYYVDSAAAYRFRAGSSELLNAYIARNFETAKRAWKAGVPFAMGSDAVFTMFGQNTRELAWFVKAGMTPEQALKTATVNAADLLNLREDIGSLQPGRYADLIAVEGDPLADIQSAIAKVRHIMKNGIVQ